MKFNFDSMREKLIAAAKRKFQNTVQARVAEIRCEQHPDTRAVVEWDADGLHGGVHAVPSLCCRAFEKKAHETFEKAERESRAAIEGQNPETNA